MQTFSLVNTSKHAFHVSMPHEASPFSLATEKIILIPWIETTPEQTLESVKSVRCPSTTNLSL